jgi:hypothetical protein
MKILIGIWLVVSLAANIWAYVIYKKKIKETIKKLDH